MSIVQETDLTKRDKLLDNSQYFRQSMAIIGPEFAFKAKGRIEPDISYEAEAPTKGILGKIIKRPKMTLEGWKVLDHDFEQDSSSSLYILEDGSMLDVVYQKKWVEGQEIFVERPNPGCHIMIVSDEAANYYLQEIMCNMNEKIYPQTIL